MAAVVCGARGRGACMGIFGIFWDFLGGLLVRHVIPRGFAVPQSGMARVQSYRGGMQRSALPQGKTSKKNPAARLFKSQPPYPRANL